MFQRILVPTDGSASSRNAAHAAIELAKSTGGSIITVHVVPPLTAEVMMDGKGQMSLAVPAEAHLGPTADREPVEHDVALMDVESQARAAGIRVTSEQVTDFGAADAIMDFAQARQCDLIVMGAERYNALMALVRGSTTQKVVAGSNVPVLVVH